MRRPTLPSSSDPSFSSDRSGPIKRSAVRVGIFLTASTIVAWAALPAAATQSGGAVIPAPSPATADLCVQCDEPAMVYRCRALGADPNAAPAQGLQIKCVTEISRDRGHGRCRIDRSKLGTACEGLFISVSPPAAALPGSPPPEVAKPVAAPPAAPPPSLANPPETMEALAKGAAEQSKAAVKDTTKAAERSLDKATTAVGGALQKSWTCLSSFFSRC